MSASGGLYVREGTAAGMRARKCASSKRAGRTGVRRHERQRGLYVREGTGCEVEIPATGPLRKRGHRLRGKRSEAKRKFAGSNASGAST
jgi:hypothetical protein